MRVMAVALWADRVRYPPIRTRAPHFSQGETPARAMQYCGSLLAMQCCGKHCALSKHKGDGGRVQKSNRRRTRRRTRRCPDGRSDGLARRRGLVGSLCSYFRSALLQFLPLRFYRNHAFGVAPIVLLQ